MKTLILISLLSRLAFSSGGSALTVFNYCNIYYYNGRFMESNPVWCNIQIGIELYELIHFDEERIKWCPQHEDSQKWKLEYLAHYRNEKTVSDVVRKILNLKHQCNPEE